jgi:membrane protease YdiL (CAAX protease family)
MDTQQQIFLAILATSVLGSLVGYGLLWRFGPRGAVLVVAAALYAAGTCSELSPWRKLDGLFGILRLVGGSGMILGTAELVLRLLTTPAATAAREQPPSTAVIAGQAAARPRPGLWASLAWCLVLVTTVRVLPADIATTVAVPGFVQHGHVVDWSRGGPLGTNGPFYRRAARVDMGAVKRSGIYAHVATLVRGLVSAAAIVVGCLLLRADVGPLWWRTVGLVGPRPVHLLATLVGVPGLWIMFAGLDTVLPNLLGSRLLSWQGFEFTRSQWSLSNPLAIVVFISAIIAEELWFRGVIGRGLTGRYGTVLGVLITSTLFALFRLDPRLAVSAFLLGVLLHLAYLAARSLAVPILIHGVVALAGDPSLRMSEMMAKGMPPVGYVGAVGLVAVAGLLLYRTRVPTAG